MKTLYLPEPSREESKRKAIAKMLSMHHDGGDYEHKMQRVGWTWAQNWINGLRTDGGLAQGTPLGMPTPTYRDMRGRRRVRFEKSLQHVQTEQGRLLYIDVAPAVERRQGVGLGGLREESVTQAFTDYVYGLVKTEGLVTTAAFWSVIYGPFGLGVLPSMREEGSWLPQVVLIPPWELRPLPAGPLGLYDVGGIEWAQWVPLSWLKKAHRDKLVLPSKRGMSEDSYAQKLDLRRAPKSSRMPSDSAPPSLGGLLPDANALRGPHDDVDREPEDEKDDEEWYAHLRQHFVMGENDSMSRCLVTVGPDWLAADTSYQEGEMAERLGGVPPVMPVHIGGYQESASFYPRSFLSRELPLAREIEYIVGEHIDNQRRMSSLRKLLLPRGLGANVRNFKAAKDGIVAIDPDYSPASFKPLMIEPPNLSEEYGPTLNMLGSMLEDLAGQGPLLRGHMPDRADSAAAARAAAEFNDVPLASCSDLFERAWAGTWRACLSYARSALSKDVNPNAPTKAFIKLGRIDETVLGLTFDPSKGTVNLSDYALPDPYSVKLTIRNKNPRPKQAIYQMLRELLASGQRSEVEVDILAIKEGLDLPTVNRSAWNAYESAWIENVLIFGDGKRSATTITHHVLTDNHSIHWIVHNELVQSPMLRLAHQNIQDALIRHMQNDHRTALGNWTEAATSVDMLGRLQQAAPGAAAAMGMSLPGMQSQVT